ncbi:MAG: hypothetical protein KDK91_00400 [Gammaproteobacteria bacterium]|nr:hypothetical protein [Gammaproteobacteria bacterium]
MDIGFVRERQRIKVKIDTFPFTHHGTIDGNDVEPGPGRAVTVEVRTGGRRLTEFLMSPLLRGMSESARYSNARSSHHG